MLRDYLYIPLGGSRFGSERTAVALLMTMALGGLWHGAGWNYLAWGVAHGAALVAVRFFGFDAPVAVKRASVFLFVAFAWILFRSSSMAGATAHFRALFDFAALGAAQLNEGVAFFAAALACFLAPNSQQIALWLAARRVHSAMLLEPVALAAIIVLLSAAFITPDTVNAFIYFEF